MNAVIYNPLEEFEQQYRDRHCANTQQFFDELVEKSGVNIDENRKTVEQYNIYKENLAKLKRKYNWLRFFRVLMIITLLLIPIVIWKMTPKIRQLREEIATADKKVEELLALAYQQMLPLNSLFTSRDCLTITENTIPLISFDSTFTIEKETDMKTNYDFSGMEGTDYSTLGVLSGLYNENPFLFENTVVHRLGEETYTGSLTIHWQETYFEDGKVKRRTRTQTLYATVTKPKPFYSTQVVLNYGAQAGPELSFYRDPGHWEKKSEREVERSVKRGEKRLKKKTDKAIKNNENFMSMSNTEFEVLFDALDRTNEVQFRSLFTPLAQTNLVDLLTSRTGYGDDYHFIKNKRMNRILSEHSQGRDLMLQPVAYTSYAFDIIKQNFLEKNIEYFRAVYFDFAPLLSIPAYQERPVHSLKPIPELSQLYSQKESEVLANAVDSRYVVHPSTKTPAILKTEHIHTEAQKDKTCITAYSYDIIPRVDYIPVLGGDGYMHNVPVPWDEYIPLENAANFYITRYDQAKAEGVLAERNGLCIMQA